MAKKIIFFNHKGGVSKTTTTYNIGWKMSQLNKKILLVDADPQCNLSSLILGDNFEEFYFSDTTKNNNIKDGVKVAFEGKPSPISAIECYQVHNNTNLILLPGHANLSEYDASLSLAQTSNNAISALQNLPGAFNELINKCAEKYQIDYVLIDLNPGLSAINQNLFTLSDGFIIPTNPDPFSVMAVTTLSNILPKWVDWVERMHPLFVDASYPLPKTKPKFIGELIQRFNVRNGQAAKPFRDNISEIKETIMKSLVPALMKMDMMFDAGNYQRANIAADFCLAEIPDFQGLLPKAHAAGVPVFALTDSQIGFSGDVLVGMQRNREKFDGIFTDITNKILHLL
jgi:chromosome partitioning protein